MKRVAIVTDSTSDVPADLLEEYGIEMVPLTVTIDGESMPDRTLSMDEFFRRMNASTSLPTTSQPAIGAFVDAYRMALESAQEVVSVHISTKLSGTFGAAKAAAESFSGKVHVVDSMNLSWGLGFQALEAAKAAAADLDSEEVIRRVESVRDKVQLLVGLDSLDNIVKGGRLSSFAGRVGGMLDVKLTISPKDGELVPVRPLRGTKAALRYGMKWIEQGMGGAKRGRFCVMHAHAEDRALWLRDAIEERYEVSEMHFMETGTVIATHTGSGWGVSFVPEA